ncbi:hypothetical protein A3F37_01180 [Candidatus Saccharibacteria bacterium RIFCSPHIGHO2_12_FULL_41_12]|nr:MAG: hypothetical protein A3F37_01180 [Candidatus Saccharibacteria bacterium RIFCSPHIGHO2_12_FULL_41_12]
MISVNDLPLIAAGLTVAIYAVGVALRVPAALIIIGALIGDFMANQLSYWAPSISFMNQSVGSLLLFVAPIVFIAVIGRKRQVKPALFDHVLRIVGTFSVVVLVSKYNYALSSDLSGSILGNWSNSVDIYVSGCVLFSIFLIISSIHKVKRSHHK